MQFASNNRLRTAGVSLRSLPTGTVTFLYTDIEGSTRLLQAIKERYADIIAEQRRQVIDSVVSHSGIVVDAVGDNVFAAFAQAKYATAAAVDVQRSIIEHPWPPDGRVRIRMGLHTGEPSLAEAGYIGIDVHRAARICAAGHGGQILLSRATRELIVNDLPPGTSLRDLGQHRLKDLARPLRLYQLIVPDLPYDFPLLRTLSVFPNNLPSQLTSFVGRGRELTEIRGLFNRNRLVTLVGVGGGGKTRLALQVAAELFETYPDGVWLVDLTTLFDPDLIGPKVLSMLGLREEPGRPIHQILMDYLRSKRLLLVMDNCEHVLRETAGLAQPLLQACPNLQILATSREPLHVPGEVIFRVASLRLPEATEITADQLVKFEAVQLFIDRAVTVLPGFKLMPENAKTVGTICRRLDGIPLAIELAAARVRALSPEQIAERLDDRFRLLTGRGYVDVPQHQTLQAAMDWSYDLLSAHEQIALRRLSVFPGGLTLESAERVCGIEPLRPAEILDLITNLVDKSLVQYQAEEERYDLLETVRQYAENRLLEAGEIDQLQARHLDFFLDLSEAADLKFRTAEAASWLDRIEAEHDNLRAALRWSLIRDVASAARIAGAVWWFWLVRGHWSEGSDWLRRVLEGLGPTTMRAKLLNASAMLTYYQRDFKGAEHLVEQALSLCRSLSDRAGEAFALCLKAENLRGRVEYARVVSLAEESVALFQSIGESWGRGFSLLALGATIMDADRERAVGLLEESLKLFRTVGDPWGILHALGRLGRIAAVQGDFVHAGALFGECRALSQQLRDRWEAAAVLGHLGFVARVRGHYSQARELLEQSLTMFERLGDKNMRTYPKAELALLALYEGDRAGAARQLAEAEAQSRQPQGDKMALAGSLHRLATVRQVEGALGLARSHLVESLWLYRDLHDNLSIASVLSDLGKLRLSEGAPKKAARLQKRSLLIRKKFGARYGEAQCLERLAAVAAIQSRSVTAARLLGAADAVREVIEVPLPPIDVADHERTLVQTRAMLGATSFDAAWSEGRRMTLEQAVDYALQQSLVSSH